MMDTANQILWWVAGLIAVAGGLKAILYLIEKGREAGSKTIEWFDERRRAQRVLAELTDDEGWPNGSHSIVQSHHNLYEKVSYISITLDELAKTIEEYVLERRRSDGDD